MIGKTTKKVKFSWFYIKFPFTLILYGFNVQCSNKSNVYLHQKKKTTRGTGKNKLKLKKTRRTERAV